MTEPARRIAIVCQPWDSVAPQTGSSIPIIAYQLARHLARDWHVTIYGRRGPGQKRREFNGENIEFKRFTVFQKPRAITEVILGIQACYFKLCVPYVASHFYHFFYALRIALNLKQLKCEVIYVHNFLQFASLIKFFNPSARIYLHMHCYWLTEFATPATERRLRQIDSIITCSDYITETIRTRFPAVASRCHTVYNGVDPDLFRPAQDVRSEGNRTEQLLYVGRLCPEKGVHILIQAFKILAQRRPTLRLDLVGAPDAPKYIYGRPDLSDPAIASLESFYGITLFDMVRRQLILRGQSYLGDLAAEAAGDDRITFRGAVLHTDTIAFYHQARLMVLPSCQHEGFGIPAAEAMACELPVVATYSGGVQEVVEHGRTGLLVARGDAGELARAIDQLLDDPTLARAMGQAGRQRVLERFTWAASTRRLAELIESLPFSVPQMEIAAQEKRLI